MSKQVRDIMTRDPKTIGADDPIVRAAELMRDDDVGDLIVRASDGTVQGIVTDRDIAVRAVAEGRDPTSARVAEVCSSKLTTVGPEDDLETAVQLMRQHAVRRLPVMDEAQLVGAISIGDLAMELDPDSALADISGARGNR